MSNKPPAVDIAKEQRQPEDEIVERCGIRGRLVAVSPGLPQDAAGRLEPPAVPMWHNEKKGRDEPNPSDPSYLVALQKYESDRGKAAMDTLAMEGIELLDPLPPDGKWIKRLKLYERRGTLDLSWVDWDDEVDLEFLFKRYVWARAGDLGVIGLRTGISPEAIASARRSFRSEEERSTNRASDDKERG
jgi:hypothetical protein